MGSSRTEPRMIVGVQGLFSGIGPTLVREMLGNMAYFAVYESVKNKIMRLRGLQEGDTLTFIFSGGFAGMAYWTLIYPVDTVKSIIQSRSIQEGSGGAWSVAAEVYREQGVKGLYRGLSPALLRAFPACAATFTAFEWTLRGFDWVTGAPT
jgi:solute carrier family 25 (mitochondrial carnitine/acylcarnitine transporter), member 20/29